MRLFRDRDFTPLMYRNLLETLRIAGYRFQTFEEYCSEPAQKVVILRHDVDRKPGNAVHMAGIEAELGIKASYHFRSVKSSNVPGIIREIAESGHEIAYHYEDLATAWRRSAKRESMTEEELSEEAVNSFRTTLEYFRQYYPVRVISMHGSPAERVDNRILWKYYDYHEFGLICEAYFNIDHSEMLYLTDTGGRWDGDKFNVRDKPVACDKTGAVVDYGNWKSIPTFGSLMNPSPETAKLRSRYKIHSTKEIILLTVLQSLPDKMIFNTHPERWHTSLTPWLIEVVIQHIKNFVKLLIIRYRHK